MASEVEICNLALSHLGDAANVASIDPPEGSAQAEHCARFFRPALSAVLAEHPWSFISARATLASLAAPASGWAYAYALPADCLAVQAVIDPGARDDFSDGSDYAIESGAAGDRVLLTNVGRASVRYTRDLRDAGKLPPFVAQALARLLASMLAGPVVKGDAGRAAAKEQIGHYTLWLGRAKLADSQQRRVSGQIHQWTPGWVSAR